jgi:REP element-mobilizing transposase RayT
MSSYRQHLYHVVFRTKDSLHTIRQDHVNDLYAYITGIIKHKKSHLYRIIGVENHLHILTDINPSIAPIDFMRDVKVSSSLWMKSSSFFPAFNGWAVGYGSFTCSYKDINRLIEYLKNQKEHHKKTTFDEEYRNLLLDNGITPDEKYFP